MNEKTGELLFAIGTILMMTSIIIYTFFNLDPFKFTHKEMVMASAAIEATTTAGIIMIALAFYTKMGKITVTRG